VVQLGPNDVVTWYEHPAGAWAYYHHWGQDALQVIASLGNTIASAISDAQHALSKVVNDVTSVVGTVLQYAQIAASFIPGIGQVVNEVVSVAEAAIDALSGMSALAIAFDAAYHAVMSSVPGLETLGPFLNPMVDFLKNLINGGMAGAEATAVHAALGAVLQKLPAEPSVGDYSPRSIAASLAGWVLSKLGVPH
jgi:ABC-type transporter Mla subunit MlaD